jgi:Tfp pilus assembly protein FimT
MMKNHTAYPLEIIPLKRDDGCLWQPISNGAYSLVELLVVLSIIAVMAGVGLAVLSFSGRQMGFQGVRGEIVSMLRYTRSNAITEKGTSTLVIDPVERRIYTCARRTVGLWHFEDNTNGNSTGAFGNNAQLNGDADIFVDGRIGNCFMITSIGWAQCGTIPIMTQNQGISIECWISATPPALPTKRTVIELSNGGISIEDDDSIEITYGGLSTRTSPAFIPYQRWTHIVMTYEPDYTLSDNSGILSLYVNNMFVGSKNGIAAVMPGKWDVMVSNPVSSFIGMIDEVKISVIAEIDKITLESDISIIEGASALATPLMIQFDKKGNLVQPVSPLTFISSSARDSFILEVTFWGSVKIR